MRVLQVNKFFFPNAGAETAFFQTRALLEASGHEVVDFAMEDPRNVPSPTARHFAPNRSYADGGSKLKRIGDAASSVYSPGARKALAGLLDEVQVDVAHLHNIYHQLTFSLVDELHKRGIPTVLTLHDWKIACPSYTLFLDGEPCRRCVSKTVPLPAVRHRCVKGSLAGSVLGAAETSLSRVRGSYGRVDRLIAPSRFAAQVASMSGYPAGRIDVIPNFLSQEELDVPFETGQREPVLLFAGRLEASKGIPELLRAFADVPAPTRLRIAGEGTLEADVRAAAAADDRIEFLGRLPREQVYVELGRARALVLPSVWEDNGPMIMLEAQARGCAIVSSDRGGAPEFVRDQQDGLVIDPHDRGALTAALTRIGTEPATAAAWGGSGRLRLEAEHAPSVHLDRLLTTYSQAIGTRRERALERQP